MVKLRVKVFETVAYCVTIDAPDDAVARYLANRPERDDIRALDAAVDALAKHGEREGITVSRRWWMVDESD